MASARSLRSTVTRVGPPSIGKPPSTRRKVGEEKKRAEDVSLNVTVECEGVARANWRQSSRAVGGMPQFTISELCFGEENSKDRKPAWASRLMSNGGTLPTSMISTPP